MSGTDCLLAATQRSCSEVTFLACSGTSRHSAGLIVFADFSISRSVSGSMQIACRRLNDTGGLAGWMSLQEHHRAP